MLAAIRRFATLPGLEKPVRYNTQPAAIYATIAVLALMTACGSMVAVRATLAHSHLIEAHYSHPMTNQLLTFPHHYPVFTTVTRVGRQELRGLTVCNCYIYRKDEAVWLWYDPANPNSATPDRFADVWFFPLLMIVAACGFGIFAVLSRQLEKDLPVP